MARVTVQNIADQLGVSKFAVSRALANKPGVSDETRRQITETAHRMGYVARANSRKSSSGIEVIFHDPQVSHRELWVDVQAGIQQEATQLGFSTAVRWSADPGLPARLKADAAGFILVGPQDLNMIEAVRLTGLPCVQIGSLVPPLEVIDQVGTADTEATSVIADHLVQLGHRHFLYAHGRPGYAGRSERRNSFASAVARTAGTIVRDLGFSADNEPGDFRATITGLLSDTFRPTAFFCGNDEVAVTVVTELLREGVRVPEDISVVGFADYPVASFVSPKLTTVRQPHRDMGIAAVHIIHARDGRAGHRTSLPPQRLNLVGKLIVRESTSPASADPWQRIAWRQRQ